MTGCPDWDLLAVRRERDGADPEGWAEALVHFDACRECRREALAADPLLVFRRLPAPDLPPAEERSEVDSMRQAVAAMRTAKRLEPGPRFTTWRRWAAAAVLAAASLSMGQDKAPEIELAALAPAASLEAAVPTVGETSIEGLDGDSRIYQMHSDDLRVVMVLNESFPERP